MRPAWRRMLVVLAVAGAGLVPAPATAAGYCSGSGVSVVVDFGALGGGIQKGCDASGNRNAAKAFFATDHPLTYAQRQPGFVCRVDGVPQSDPCVNTSPSDAYWGLYWSDGKSGWTYSSLGAGSLNVPAGATVAFSWQNGGTADPPGTAPAVPAAAAASPKPTPKPTPKPSPSKAPGGGAGPSGKVASPAHPATASALAASPTGGSSSTPSASASAAASSSAPAAATTGEPSPSAGPTSASAAGPVETQSATTSEGDGLPWWVPVLVLLALLVGGGTAWWTRRRPGAGQST